MPWYDIVLMLVGTACFLYFAFNALPIIKLATRIQTHHVIIGAIGILVLIEFCRRCVGVPILCVLGALLIYTFYNQLSYNPSLYQALKNIVYKLFYTTNGVIGTPDQRLLHLYRAVHHLRRVPRAHGHCKLLHRVCKPSGRLVGRRSCKGRGYLLGAVRHGLRLFRRQHRDHRLGYHPDDEKDRLSPGLCGRSRSGGLHGRPDHAPHHGRGGVPDGRIHGPPLRNRCRQGNSAGSSLFHGHLHCRPSGSQKLGLKGLSKDEMPKWAVLFRKSTCSHRWFCLSGSSPRAQRPCSSPPPYPSLPPSLWAF